EKIRKPDCFCDACKVKENWVKSKKNTSTISRVNKTAVAVVIGWIFFAYLAYRISTVKVEVEIWDPYEVLGLSEGDSLDTIKKHYKKLSLIWQVFSMQKGLHTEHEEKFIDFTKAYKVLTDEDTRRNYEEYGHPDGKQAYSLGIALPTWLVEAKNSPFVLGVYGIAFGLLLPFFVGRWWYSSSCYTKDKILTHTMELYFKELRDNSSIKQILDLLSASLEYMKLIEQRSSDGTKLGPVVLAVKDELDKKFGEKYEKSKRYTSPYCQKASALLYAHLLRVNVEDKELLKDKYFIAEHAVHLINGVLEIALAHRWLQTSIRCMEVSQFIVQAMWLNESQLVQLPYVTSEVLKAMKIKKKVIKNIAQFRAMNDEERKNILKLPNPAAYDSLVRVAEMYPIMIVEKAYFKVAGDEVITVSSIVTLMIKVKIVDPSKPDDAVDKKSNDTKSDDENDDEKGNYIDSEDELLYGKKRKFVSQEKSPLVHAPYLSKDKKPYWWIFMADEKKDRIVIEPIKVSDITTTRVFDFQFQAPREPGLYSYVVYIKSDSYVGADIRKEMKLVVKDISALPPEDEIDDEISEPEEDSLAGQMKLMREQGLAAAVTGAGEKKKAESDSSDDSDDD
ncbi:7783_t:CDS:10, partial [Acaulospora morrowiae]